MVFRAARPRLGSLALGWFVPVLRRHWRLLLFLLGLFGWIDSVPLYGPAGAAWATARGVVYGSLPLWFLGAHAVSLVVWGVLLDRHPRSARNLARFALAGAAVLTALLLDAPGAAWPLLFAAMGAVTAAGMVAWGRWYATTVPSGWLGRTFALAAAALAVVKSSIEQAVPHLPPLAVLLGTIALLAAAWVAQSTFSATEVSELRASPSPTGQRRSSVIHMALFIVLFSIVAGLSYQVIVVAPSSPYVKDSLRAVPYVAGVLVCGVLADLRSLKAPLIGGAALLAVAFLFGAWGDPVAQYLGVVFNGAAFGLLEATPWLLLAANATRETVGRWFGWGLNLNVVPIFLGAAVAARLQHVDPAHVGMMAAVVLVLAMASLYGVDDPLAALHRMRPALAAEGPTMQVDRLFERRYGSVLSQREIEVGRLAVLGVETTGIARQLYISENTVKTHLRHVYRKTASTNRGDLLRKLVASSGEAD